MASYSLPSDQFDKLVDGAIQNSRPDDLELLLRNTGYSPQRAQLIDALTVADDKISFRRPEAHTSKRVMQLVLDAFVESNHGDQNAINVFEEVRKLASRNSELVAVFSDRAEGMRRPQGANTPAYLTTLEA